MPRLHAISMSLLCCLLSGVGAAAAWHEARAVLDRGQPEATRALHLSQGPPDLGLAISSRRAALIACHDSQRHPETGTLPPAARAAIAGNCAQTARSVLSRSPTDSFAWVVMAAEPARHGEWDEALRMLAISRRMAPAEQWIAAERFRLAEPMRRLMGPTALAAHESDLLILLRSHHGVRSMAAHWIARPDFRRRVTMLADTLEPPEQRRFLRHVRELMTESGMQ